MSNPITVKGYVCSVPRAADARQASVAVVQDDVEYRIIPRGAGADLADEVSALVEVTGLLEQVDEVNYIQVRGYTLVDDTSSWDDDELRFHGTHAGPVLTPAAGGAALCPGYRRTAWPSCPLHVRRAGLGVRPRERPSGPDMRRGMQGMPRLLSHDMWRRRERITRSRRLFLWASACWAPRPETKDHPPCGWS